MELVLVRHALPVRVDGRHGDSPADPGLAERGHRQAHRLVGALQDDAVTAVYASPAARARETATPLATALGLEPVVLPGLAEFDRAHASYVPVEEVRAEGGTAWELLRAGDLAALGVDAEAFRSTVVDAIEQVVAAHPGGRAVLFCHSGTISAWTAHIAGLPTRLWLAPDYASITRVGAGRDGRRGIVSVNETGHVRDLLT